MELARLAQIVGRRVWLVVAVAVVTTLVLGVRLGIAQAGYEAQAKLQLTAPQQEDVTLFDSYRSLSVRDEITVARNNLVEVLQSREVVNRTISQLGLVGEDADYSLQVTPLRDSDFLYVTVRARAPQLAEQIANAHASIGVAYYGEVRAKPAVAALNAIAEQLGVAERNLRTAEEALNQFGQENGTTALESEIAFYQTTIQQLQMEFSRLTASGADAHYTGATERTLEAAKAERARLVSLLPRYRVLDGNVRQARSEYELLLNKRTEAALKAEAVRTAAYIQVVEPAVAPAGAPLSRTLALLGLILVGGLGLGGLLAVLLESAGWPRLRRLDSAVGAAAARAVWALADAILWVWRALELGARANRRPGSAGAATLPGGRRDGRDLDRPAKR